MSGPLRDKLGEDCGVIAVYRRDKPAAELTHRGLFALQHRGQEAAGITALGPTGDLHFLKGRGLVAAALPTYKVAKLPGIKAIGHVRYSTGTSRAYRPASPKTGTCLRSRSGRSTM